MILRAAFLAAGLIGFGAPLTAQTPSESARQAVAMLDAATAQLAEAKGGRQRVAALTQTVQGYEQGLAAMRDGMRQAATREAQLTRDLASREAEVGQLLGVLQSMARAPAPVRLIHPSGPAGTARAGMLLADVTPALQAEVEHLRAQVQEITDLQLLQTQAAQTLSKGLTGAQEARTALSQAVADRTDLPRRFTEDTTQTAVMIAVTETLEGFASALATLDTDPTGPDLPPIDALRGDLPLPVSGTLLRAANQSDASGVVRPGILIAAGPEALVTTPLPATVRYAGPLLDFGLVTILEPQKGILFIFAGMAQLFGTTGQVVPAGDPIGLMPRQSQSGERAGNTRSETLYIEVRENGLTVDPQVWFRATKD